MLWQLLLVQAGFFLVLILVLQRLFHGHLINGIKRMEKLQQQNVKKEEEINRMQAAVKKHSEKRLAELDAELAQRRGEVEEELKAMKQAAAETLGEQKNLLVAQMHEKERLLSERLERENAARAAGLAREIVAGTFTPKMLEAVHQSLSEELLESLMNLDEQKICLHDKPITVETAFALSGEQTSAIRSRVFQMVDVRERAKNPEAVALSLQINPELVAGFIVHVGEKIFDGSLRNRFDRFASQGARRKA